jgi:hypothetical protein
LLYHNVAKRKFKNSSPLCTDIVWGIRIRTKISQYKFLKEYITIICFNLFVALLCTALVSFCFLVLEDFTCYLRSVLSLINAEAVEMVADNNATTRCCCVGIRMAYNARRAAPAIVPASTPFDDDDEAPNP